ncbi:hypothetical protein MKEN_00496000 [Mycena kentingensis (nom. inval.)]|nr:hypothetical protein MKEN_00496000 [Mycena kentingensis (nom. inval.)]
MQPTYTVEARDFHIVIKTLRTVACRCMVALGLYGVLSMLVVLAVRHLRSSDSAQRLPNRRAWLLAVVTVFLLATAQVGLDLGNFFRVPDVLVSLVEEGNEDDSARTLDLELLRLRLYSAKDLIMTTNNLVVDSIFIYRCYSVWSHKRYIVALPTLMLLATTIYNYTASIANDSPSLVLGKILDLRYGLILSMLTNIVLMLLTAGRIWWARRQLSSVLQDPELDRRYNTAIAMVIESGALYCINVLVVVIAETVAPARNEVVTEVFWGSLSQIMNIAPLLIIVRVGMGRTNEESANKSLYSRSLHFRTENRSTVMSQRPLSGRSVSLSTVV